MAAGLATLIDPAIVSGPVQALFTVDEETSMGGANNLGEGMIEGDILLNLDSEEDGEICMGCAGGVGTQATFEFTPTPAPADLKYIDILFKDFQGGHSGTDIDAERANVNKLIMRFIWNTMAKREVKLAYIKTGDKHNAIPVKAEAIIGVKPKDVDATIAELEAFTAIVKNEYKHTEKDMKILSSIVDAPATSTTSSPLAPQTGQTGFASSLSNSTPHNKHLYFFIFVLLLMKVLTLLFV